MGTGKMKKMSRQQQKAVGASMNEAAVKMLTPLNMFGSMGGNQMINSLTNANALAQQQIANNTGVGVNSTNYSQPAMTGNMDPMAQQYGLGMFGNVNARQAAVGASGLMMKSPLHMALGSEPSVDPCSAEFDYEIASDAGHSAEDIKKYRAANCGKEKKSGGDPDQVKAERDDSMSRDAQGETN
tara:strand:- start:5623 stop:6174 length:552 start_codon:yes stop_codon:yes gene_type:complete